MPSRIKTVGVLGGSGLLGADLVDFLGGGEYETRAIKRENYAALRGVGFDIFINANGNSKRFWANQNPLADFEASTLSVYRSLFDFKFKKYVYISSSDVYPDHGNPAHNAEDVRIDSQQLAPYGLHKYLAETIIKNHVADFLILRSSMILGTALRKGPIYDILHEKELFITLDSRLQFITTREVASVLRTLLGKNIGQEVFNMGGRGSFSFSDIGRYLKKTHVLVSNDAKKQEYEMDVEKLHRVHSLQASEEYLKEFIHGKK